MRAHNEAVNRLDFMPERAPITAEYAPGEMREVLLHDGGTIRLRKVHADYDPEDKIVAMNYLQERAAAGEIVTGLLYVQPQASDLHDAQETVDVPLNALGTQDLVPGSTGLAAFNAANR